MGDADAVPAALSGGSFLVGAAREPRLRQRNAGAQWRSWVSIRRRPNAAWCCCLRRCLVGAVAACAAPTGSFGQKR
ncbi:hypothetical protein GLE_2151 [Lysobacter enzymogenes]|uniref:Uncharacterized protein n=1 Tax=Lysobacter enzymogenes TaxID=69 RepID=A0A0S2DGH6_LYSEN|nr:hypothetical protein GLE_2151 [Lysobacter enzymogenes]